MKCLLCESASLLHICPTCSDAFFTPSIHKQKLSNGIEVLSFYKYKNIKKFLHTKHTDIGYYIYKTIAEKSLKKFALEFNYEYPLVSLAIDDNVASGYSHTAILNKALKSKTITPLHSKLRAKNKISYSGKSREFRLLNPRDFELKKFKQKNVILVDDIITTGSTLSQASTLLKTKGKEVLFCLTLAC